MTRPKEHVWISTDPEVLPPASWIRREYPQVGDRTGGHYCLLCGAAREEALNTACDFEKKKVTV